MLLEKPIGRQVECKQCEHTWHARIAGRDPLICPACRSWYWNIAPELAPKPTFRKKRKK
jgi:hypothetical protein